jgi:hypothetical protein
MSMPAGKYYVGDLCYVMHPQWDEFCALTDRCLEGEFTLANGVRFATYETKYGDGSYLDAQAREYGVDAGLIGCIRVEDIDPAELKNLDLGHVVEFQREFETSGGRSTDRRWDGVIRFGHLAIETDPQDEEDEDYYEDEEEELED